MKNVKITRTPALTAVGATAVLALTACSGSEGFDFTEHLAEAPASIEFSVPADLAELNENYLDNRFYDSITLTAVESEDPSMCAVEYRYDFAKEGLDRLLEIAENSEDVRDGDYTLEEQMGFYLTHVKTSAERTTVEEGYGSAVVDVDCASSPRDDDSTVRVSLAYHNQEEDTRSSIASAEVSVMRGAGKDGELYVHEFKTPGWQVDSNGNWIAD
ncbi:hypothetical protein [Nocardiopsis sp. NPDC006938]|uniref:hypothetical protein n=1 Tax=Nocardiopsis sp. NPDC006938 TaxID=3364337 RepID=UPI0036D16845